MSSHTETEVQISGDRSRTLYEVAMLIYVPQEIFSQDNFFNDLERPSNYHQRKFTEDRWVYLIHRTRWGANPRGVRRLPQEGLGWKVFDGEFSEEEFLSNQEYRSNYELKALDSILKQQLICDPEHLDGPRRSKVAHRRRLTDPPRTPSNNGTLQFYDRKETTFYYAMFKGTHRDIELGEGITEGMWAPESDLLHEQLAKIYCIEPVVEGIRKVLGSLAYRGEL